MNTVADLIQKFSRLDPASSATDALGAHMQSMVPQPTTVAVEGKPGEVEEVAPPEPTEASVVPPFIAKMLCFALPLLRKLVKLNGDQSNAVDVLIALVCSQS